MPPRKLVKKTGKSSYAAKGKGIVVDGEERSIGGAERQNLNLIASSIEGKKRSSSNMQSPATLISDLLGVKYKVRIHHSGRFSPKPNREYVGGYDICYPLMGVLQLTLSDLSNTVQKFHGGYEDLPVYFKIPGMDLDLGLKVLGCEDDVHEIVENMELIGCDEVDLYLDESSSFKESNIRVSPVNETVNVVDPLLPDSDAFLADCVGNLNFNDELEQMCQSVEASLGNNARESADCDMLDDSESDSEFRDSDYGVDDEDDDELYEACVDKSVEFGGVSELGNIAGGSSSNVLDGDIIDDDQCGLSDDLHSVHSSDDENCRLPEFNAKSDMNKVDFSVGMLFSTKDVLRKAILEYGLQNGKAVKTYKNDKVRVRARCNEGNCPWQLYAAVVKGDVCFQIRSYQSEHNCGRVFRNKAVRAPWLAEKYLNDFRADPQWSIKSFTARLASDYIVGCSRSQLYRARSKAISLVTGSEMEQYSKVYDYCEELRKSNPGTTAIVQTEPSLVENGRPTFKRIYICLGACKNGFKAGCRKVIGVDGCHLKGSSTGQILAAVGVDANNQSFPIAYAVVEVENKDSWEWFLELLKNDVGITRENEREFTFINDKQKGLIPALEALVGEAELRHCAWHLYTNFKEHHRGRQLKEKMDQASKATTVPAFHKAMAELRKLSEEAYKWLTKADEPSFWSRSHFRTLTKCDMLTNNPCESFNSFIKEARDKPILSLCETIRNLLMERMSFRKKKMMSHKNKFYPQIVSKLEKLKKESCSWSPLWAGGLLYQVACSDYEQYAVDLEKRTCGCRKWDLNGIPCCHAIAAIYHQNFVPEDFVNDCYLTETNLRIYNDVIYPMNGQSMWVETPYNKPLPPPYKKQPGRPKKLRRRGITEQPLPKTGKMSRSGMGNKCRTCGGHGHNSRHHNKKQKTNDAEGSQTGGTENVQQVPVSQSSICQSSTGQERQQVPMSQPSQLRRSPRKQLLSTSGQTPTQMSQTSMGNSKATGSQAKKLQPRRNSKASAVTTGVGSAAATATAMGNASANAKSVSGKAQAKASSTIMTSKQASKYQNLVKQGKFREM